MYVNLILWKKTFLEKNGLWGEAEVRISRDFGSKDKILLGRRGNYFYGFEEINALFSGIKGAQTPPGGPQKGLRSI